MNFGPSVEKESMERTGSNGLWAFNSTNTTVLNEEQDHFSSIHLAAIIVGVIVIFIAALVTNILISCTQFRDALKRCYRRHRYPGNDSVNKSIMSINASTLSAYSTKLNKPLDRNQATSDWQSPFWNKDMLFATGESISTPSRSTESRSDPEAGFSRSQLRLSSFKPYGFDHSSTTAPGYGDGADLSNQIRPLFNDGNTQFPISANGICQRCRGVTISPNENFRYEDERSSLPHFADWTRRNSSDRWKRRSDYFLDLDNSQRNTIAASKKRLTYPYPISNYSPSLNDAFYTLFPSDYESRLTSDY